MDALRYILIITTCASILCLSSQAHAELYQYEDNDGNIIITSTPKTGLKVLKSADDVPKGGGVVSLKAGGGDRDGSHSRRHKANEDEYDDIIEEASEEYGLPFAFIKAVIKVESNFNPDAVSRTKAMGLMQLMPATALMLGVRNPFDGRQNIMAGSRFLRRQADRYDGDLNRILTAYHAGPSAASKDMVPYDDTLRYIKNVLHWYRVYSSRSDI